MSLLIKLSNGLAGGSRIEYDVPAENVSHSGNRLPTQAGLPEKGVIFLDLGVSLEQITVTGVCDETNSPTKSELRDAFDDWYGNMDFDVETGYVELTLSATETYKGGIKSYNFRQEAAKESFWSFNFVFLVKSKKA